MLRVLIFSVFTSSAAFAAESGGMPQLDPNSWVPQIFWLIITFGFLYLVISKIVFPRLSESIEQRNDYVSDLVDEAKKLAEQTEKLNKDYEEFISNSKKEAQEIITNGRKKLNSEFDKKKHELDNRILELTKTAEKEIESFKANSINEVQMIANQISEELLKELSLKDEIDQNIISKKIEEISKKKIGELN
jgi:F-type H+-transporting ATPase subunit b